MDYTSKLSTRTRRMGASAIREILKVIGKPGMVSLAGGLPAEGSFPLAIVRELTELVLDKYGPRVLQYDTTEGFLPLRETLIPFLAERGITAELPNVVVSSGSQSILDLLAKVLISPGDRLAIEAPSYLGALTAFNPYEPSYVSIETDAQGVIPEALEEVLDTYDVKLIYLVPTFQNPTGRTIPVERRQRIAEIVQERDVLVIEDDPYSALRYSGEPVPPLKTFAPEHVIYISTFSKILSPGLRIGFAAAPAELTRWMVIAKQGVDLHTSPFGQAIAAEYLAGGHLAAHLPTIINLYKPRRDAMLSALDAYMPPEFTWSRPGGGMFIWAEGPEGFDSEALYWNCIERNVAFVPGYCFYGTPHLKASATLRLNFTKTDAAQIGPAVKVVAEEAEKALSALEV